ncbi:MAG: ABC transporter substrate-binding protein [Atribacterota bacterium]|jgi:branched-chain amino acid transport system substrate-binding protein|nr:ABC transporter substrate-binding protein [Atribacterota bacterium]
MKNKFFRSFSLPLVVIGMIIIFSFNIWGQEVVVDEWRIPFLNCVTGPIASIGEYMSWSANRAAEEINAAGGVRGKPIKIEIIDTGVSKDKAMEEMAKVVDWALVVMGPVPEACIMAAVPIAVKAGLFCMPSSTSYEYTVEYFPWTLSWYPPTEEKLPPITAAWAELHPDMKTVVQFVENWAAWPPMAKAHAIGIESVGVKMLKDVDVPTDAVMFEPLVLKALAQNPDGIVLTCSPEKAAKIIIELEKKGWEDKSKILVFSSADDTALYTTGGKSLDGISIYNYINLDLDDPRWQAFREAYKKDHNGIEPASLSTNYYDSVYMIKEAIENTEITGDPSKLAEERIKIRDYCRNVKGFKGIQLTWDMTDGVPTGKGAFLFVLENGEKKFLAATK